MMTRTSLGEVIGLSGSITVADEVWVGCALFHYENPHRADFTTGEIVKRVARENIFGRLRRGV